MITAYSQLLVRTHAHALSEKADTYVDYIIGGTSRMRDLLADLLAYTEIGAHAETSGPIDLNVAMRKALDNLRMSIDDSRAIVTSKQLPPRIKVNEAHFVSLFQNLISNAIKYRSAEPPRIHVAVAEMEGHFRFEVTDNGIGIAPEYHLRIFAAFKRLHGNEIAGTGIGLAICQRIVERYGGRLWVESKLGAGATFIFTLPSDASGEHDAQSA